MNCHATFPGLRGNRTADVAYPKPPKRWALLGVLLVLASFIGVLAIGQAVWS